MEIAKVRFLAEDGYSGGIPDIVNPTERIKYDTRNPINELIAWPYKVFFLPCPVNILRLANTARRLSR